MIPPSIFLRNCPPTVAISAVFFCIWGTVLLASILFRIVLKPRMSHASEPAVSAIEAGLKRNFAMLGIKRCCRSA